MSVAVASIDVLLGITFFTVGVGGPPFAFLRGGFTDMTPLFFAATGSFELLTFAADSPVSCVCSADTIKSSVPLEAPCSVGSSPTRKLW